MPQITVWECPRTNMLFKTKAQYKRHLKKKARESLEAKYHQKIVDTRLDVFRKMRETCCNAAEIEQFVKDNVKVFWAHAIEQSYFDKDKIVPKNLVCKHFKITARYNDMVSNSHHCPMNGGVTNWCGKTEGAPRGYPGFYGKVDFEFSHGMPSSSSTMFEDTGLETGGGGGSQGTGSYEIYLFLADWPTLTNRIEEMKKMRMVEEIKTGRPTEVSCKL
jgi:uncharacterized C2H2 Zn-finger protein